MPTNKLKPPGIEHSALRQDLVALKYNIPYHHICAQIPRYGIECMFGVEDREMRDGEPGTQATRDTGET